MSRRGGAEGKIEREVIVVSDGLIWREHSKIGEEVRGIGDRQVKDRRGGGGDVGGRVGAVERVKDSGVIVETPIN